MLSVFPSLFSYALVVPFVFRLVIGLVFLVSGYKNITKNRESKIKTLTDLNIIGGAQFWFWLIVLIEIVGGVLILLGVYTQVVALIFSIMLLITSLVKRKHSEVTEAPQTTLLLLLLVTASLLFLGPGFYAFDLPL